MREVFLARVVRDGKVTIPRQVRDLMHVEQDDYVRLSLLEVIKKNNEKG